MQLIFVISGVNHHQHKRTREAKLQRNQSSKYKLTGSHSYACLTVARPLYLDSLNVSLCMSVGHGFLPMLLHRPNRKQEPMNLRSSDRVLCTLVPPLGSHRELKEFLQESMPGHAPENMQKLRSWLALSLTAEKCTEVETARSLRRIVEQWPLPQHPVTGLSPTGTLRRL